MSQREFFSFRFTVPGLILILIVIATNYAPLFEVLSRFNVGVGEVLGAFLAFLSLFAGVPLGFLISQIWWLWFDEHGRIFGTGQGKRLEEKFIEEYKQYGLTVPPNKSGTERKKDLERIFDYISLLDPKDKELWSYCARKWDMYHVLSATWVSLILGLVLGFFIRTYYQIFVMKPFAESWSANPMAVLAEFFAQLSIIGFTLFFAVLICFQREDLDKEYCETLKNLMRHHKSKLEQSSKNENPPDMLKALRITFPDYFKPNAETSEHQNS